MRTLTIVALLLCSANLSFTTQVAHVGLPVCQVIATGGTIAMKIDPVKQAPVPALSGEDLVARIPDLAGIARIQVSTLFNIPSTEMNPERWVALKDAVVAAAAREELSGVVVTHGTDTMEETAYFLDLTVSSDKPIILVGAQRNASERDSDGPRNLLNATRICVAPEARGKGVIIAMNGKINAAREATKTQTSDVETFKSGDYGFLGVVDQDRLVFARTPTRRQYVPVVAARLPRVEIVPMYAGADGTLLKAAVDAGAKGIVIEATGLGGVNSALYDALSDAIRRDVVMVVSTRVPNGRVVPVYGTKGGGKTLKDAGAVFADNLSPQKARILLMLALQTTSKPSEIQQVFDR